jgi:MYXO-CTERM domain-containing protein
MSFKPSIFSLGALVLAFGAAPRAQAQTCTSNAQCHKGFICVLAPTNIGTPTPGAPTTADPTAPAKTSALVAPSTGYCQEAPCTADTDCGTGMVCHTETYPSCTGGTAPACPPNTDCGAKVAPPPQTCTETKVSLCMFTWQLPCNTDTECGAGFVCNPTVTGCASGGSGTTAPGGTGTAPSGTGTGGGSAPSSGAAAPADPGFAADPIIPPDACKTTTTFPGYCSPKATTCASNTDCPTDWTCTAVSTASGGGTSSSATGAAGTAGSTRAGVPADAAILPGPGPSAPPTMMCTSPYGVGYGAPKVSEDGSAGGGTTTTAGTGAAGTRGTGNTGPTGGAAGTGGGEVPPSSQTPSPTHETAGGNPNAAPSAGCAVAGGGSSAMLAALALLGIVIARRRR